MASPPRNATSVYTLFQLLDGMMVTIHEQHSAIAKATILDRPVNVQDPLCQAVSNALNACSTAALMLGILNQHLQKGAKSDT